MTANLSGRSPEFYKYLEGLKRMEEIKTIIEDKTEIHAIEFLTPRGSYWEVGGRSGIQKIVAYAENGSLGPVPYLAVYKQEQVAIKLPAHAVTIHYLIKPRP